MMIRNSGLLFWSTLYTQRKQNNIKRKMKVYT